MDSQLEEYSKELDLHSTMLLSDLINSHRELRQKNMISHQQWLKEIDNGREWGKKQGLEMITHGKYIEVEKLKKMTIGELVEFIGE